MFRKTITSLVLSLLAGSLIVLTPAVAEARPGGHGGGGGFHGGHFGGARYGGYHAGYARGGAYRGGGFYHSGYYRGGHYGRGYGYHGYRGFGGYYPYYGGLYGLPYYGSGYSYPDYGYYGLSDPNAYAPSGVPVDSAYFSDPDVPAPDTSAYLAAEPPVGSSLSAVAAPATVSVDQAQFTVTVPAGTQLWIDNTLTTSTGTVREFQSPPLTPGQTYSYRVHARWQDNGHEVDQTQRVQFTPGQHIDVVFPVTTATATQVPAVKHG
jgi:uncharacterized protein (TIGR03000 family)